MDRSDNRKIDTFAFENMLFTGKESKFKKKYWRAHIIDLCASSQFSKIGNLLQKWVLWRCQQWGTSWCSCVVCAVTTLCSIDWRNTAGSKPSWPLSAALTTKVKFVCLPARFRCCWLLLCVPLPACLLSDLACLSVGLFLSLFVSLHGSLIHRFCCRIILAVHIFKTICSLMDSVCVTCVQ